MSQALIAAMERGWVPDPAIRYGIRKLCRDRIKSFGARSPSSIREKLEVYANNLKEGPLAVHTRQANEQHYELPPEFFELVLGSNRKYSSAFWPHGCTSLDLAEYVALQTSCERAEIVDGMSILELGCGWGSLTLFMAAKFPHSQIVALSNSAPQRQYIESQAQARGLKNIKIITRDIVEVENLDQEFGKFDRAVSLEMFEHLKNYELLFQRISRWLKPDGKLFVHIFTHRDTSYPFETEGDDNWMGRYFFTGGQMPSRDLLPLFNRDLEFIRQWEWSGTHYAQTSEAWLQNMDRNREAVLKVFQNVYGKESRLWFNRWRVFFMACAELFGYRAGSEWGVTHYLFKNRSI
jgi:cyclopropane-fatty-acyl-phospholipid synthase